MTLRVKKSIVIIGNNATLYRYYKSEKRFSYFNL